MLLTLQIINISRSGWIWHRLWNLLTINLKNNSFHNSVDWAELYLQVYIPSQLGKIFRCTVFKLLGNVFMKLRHLWEDLIINSSCRTTPLHKFASKNYTLSVIKSFFLEKDPTKFYEGETLCPCSTNNHAAVFGPSNLRLQFINILKLEKRVVWQSKSVGWSII